MLEELTRFEELNSIEKRWVPTSKEYQEASVMMFERRYWWVLDNIEFLVVQHLMETTKLGASGVSACLHLPP
jgi:hypothetical protein